MVSIIIPYINEHDYLAAAMDSAKGQQDVETEIIIVCNAPVIDEGYNPIPADAVNSKFIHQPQPGSAHARNAGLLAATGEWIQFLDVDDLLLPGKIQHQLKLQDADVIVSPHRYRYMNGKSESSKWLPGDIWCGLLNSGLGSTSSMIWKRQALIEVGGWNTDFQSHQEYELLFRLLTAGKKIFPNDHCETIVRQRASGSITNTSKPVRVKEGILLREAMWNYLLSKSENTPERFEAFRQYLFKQMRGLFRQDRVAAMALFDKYFSSEPFIPHDIHVPGYTLLYKLFGFMQTETFVQYIASLRK